MKRRWVILAFLVASVIDVRVKADSLNERPVEIPGGCWSRLEQNTKNSVCAFLSGKARHLMKLPFGSLRMSPEASLVITRARGETTVRLVRGIFWLNARTPIKVRTLYARVRVANGELLIGAQDRRSDITNLTADLNYRPRGSTRVFPLPKGMVVTIGRVATTGVARTEFPRTANVKTLLRKWARVYSESDINEFQRRIDEFLPAWVQATEDVGPWYTQVVNRELASAEQEKERKARLLSKHRAEIKRLRNLFRAQNFMN